MNFKIDVKNVNDQIVVMHLVGEMDIYCAPQLKEKASQLIKEGRAKIILEMSELAYIDSTGLGSIISVLTSTKENGGHLCLVSPSKPVARLLEIVGIDDKILRVFSNIDEAVSFIKRVD